MAKQKSKDVGGLFDTEAEDMEAESRLILLDLADLFDKTKDMGELDASAFVDNAGKIWDLRERARKLLHR